ncbi:NAD(P)(+) transhydrogenase (Re/Si-specific) subunit beta, partial [Porphyromonas gingivalis]
PGYAGVDNPLYTRATGVFLKLGDAKESLAEIMKEMDATSDTAATAAPARAEKTAGSVLRDAKRVIIVPGYGMALAQAQHQVRQLADKLT